MVRSLRILLVGIESSEAEVLRMELQHGGFQPEYVRVETPTALSSALQDPTLDVAITHRSPPHFGGRSPLDVIRESGTDIPFILLFNQVSAKDAAEIGERGANIRILKNEIKDIVPVLKKMLIEVNNLTGMEQEVSEPRVTEDSFRVLAGISHDGVVVVSGRGGILFVNDRTAETTGYTIPELLQLDLKDLILYPDPEIQPSTDEGGQLDFPVPKNRMGEIIGKNGEKVPVEITGTSVIWMDQSAMLFSFRGITGHEQMEKALLDSKERSNAFIRASPDAVIITDLKGRITELSQRMLEMSSLQRNEEILGKSILELISPEDRDKAIGNLRKVLKNGVVRGVEYSFIKRDGSRFIGEVHSALVCDAQREPKDIINMVRDITTRKIAEEEMKRKLMVFRLENGKLYLVKEDAPTLSIEAFKDLLKIGKRCCIISRTPEVEFRQGIEDDFDFIWIAEIGGINTISPSLDDIESFIMRRPIAGGIMIHGVDYLILRNGFPETLAFVQHLSEIAHLSDHVVILSIDSSLLDEREMKFFEKETNPVEPLYKDVLTYKLLRVMKYLYKQDLRGEKTSYGDIIRELGISKPTVRTRLEPLIYYGYVKVSKSGTYKMVELTDKGKDLISD